MWLRCFRANSRVFHRMQMSTLTPLKMPALSPTMESGTLAAWRKKEGEMLNPGDVLCEVETDKATVDYEMQDEAVLAKIMVKEGTADIPVGVVLAYTVEDADEYEEFVASGEKLPETPAKVVTSAEPSSPAVKKASSRKPLIQFLGKRSKVAAKAPAAATVAPIATASNDEYTDIPVSSMRRIIATRLTQSKATVPHYYSSVDCEIDSILKLRKKLKTEHQVKVSLNDFILKSVASALKQVPEANSTWNDQQKIAETNESVDISVAVATEAGLITPIVAGVEQKGLGEINQVFTELVGRARQNRLQPHEFQGGTFTVSNLGGFGISNFTAVINPPQACILAVGGGQRRVVPQDDDLRVATTMNVTLSADRRVVTDATAGRFLQAFQYYMQNPELLIL